MTETTFAQAMHAALRLMRDRDADPRRRAFAATTVGALCNGDAAPNARADRLAAADADPALRMFAFGTRHPDAPSWDGRGARSGTITYVDAERIEQYVGAGQWLAYAAHDLGFPEFVVGDRVRIGRRDGRVAIEAVGDNRLAGIAVRAPLGVTSGVCVYRPVPLSDDEWRLLLQTAVDRFDAGVDGDPAGADLRLNGAVLRLRFTACDRTPQDVRARLGEPPACALRIEAAIDDAGAALTAERALAVLAAFAAGSGGAVVCDDSGARLDAAELYDVALAGGTRADLFPIAAAAARRLAPPRSHWFAASAGICDELSLVSARPWRAEVAAAFFSRAIAEFADARRCADDDVIPRRGVVHDATASDPSGCRALFTLEFDRAYLRIGVLEPQTVAAVGTAPDIAALLAAPPATGIVFTYGASADDTSNDVRRDMQRADTLATALAARAARRLEGIAARPDGVVCDASMLTELALQRRGAYALGM